MSGPTDAELLLLLLLMATTRCPFSLPHHGLVALVLMLLLQFCYCCCYLIVCHGVMTCSGLSHASILHAHSFNPPFLFIVSFFFITPVGIEPFKEHAPSKEFAT